MLYYYHQIKVLNSTYYLVKKDNNLIFIGQENGSLAEILKKFNNQLILDPNKENYFEIQKQLEAYFLEKQTSLTFPIELIGTPFQQKVWKLLTTIEYGKTKTYLEVAQMLGDHKKVRAVANAIGQNPLLIVIPCHRVIGSDGKLHGYRGGIKMKQALLNLERQEQTNANN